MCPGAIRTPSTGLLEPMMVARALPPRLASAVALPRASNEEVKRVLTRVARSVTTNSQDRYTIVFGAARAHEARRSFSDWMALADLRFQQRQTRMGMGDEVTAALLIRRAERRQTGRR